MLRHDDNTEESASSAAQVRVTPQELAEALARLDARQGERDGTIPLGDAVQELGLSASPEELLREIEVGRTRNRSRLVPAFSPKSHLIRVGSALSCALLLFVGLSWFRTANHSSAPAMVAIPSVLPPQAAPLAIPDNLLVRRADHTMVLLSEVGDNQPVLCELAATETGAKFTDFAPASLHWTLIKHSGKVYLRGWIGDMSATALRSTVVSLHPSAYYVTSGLRPVRVTLPVNAFQSPPGLTNDDMISVSHLVPDEHLNEKW